MTGALMPYLLVGNSQASEIWRFMMHNDDKNGGLLVSVFPIDAKSYVCLWSTCYELYTLFV